MQRRLFLRAAVAMTAAALAQHRANAMTRWRTQASTPDFSGVITALRAAVADGDPPWAGLTVVTAEETLLAVMAGAASLDHVDLIASATKMPSASAIMTLVDDGALSLDDPVSRYVPSFSSDKAAITVRQCLSHTSGLPADAPALSRYDISLAEAVEEYAGLPLVAPPGTRFVYGGVSYSVAGRVAEIVSGHPWAEFFAQRIATPLGLSTFTYGQTRNPRIAGGAACSLGDYATLLQLHLGLGMVNGTRVLSAEAVAEMQRDQVAARGATFSEVAAESGKKEYGYGLAWWFDELAADGTPTQISDAGLFGAIPWIDRQRGYGAFLFVRTRLTTGVRLFATLLPLIRQAIDGAS